MKGTVKMTGVQEQGNFELPPEGVYTIEVIDKKDGYSKGGDSMVTIKLGISIGDYKGMWVWDNIIIADDPESPGYKILGRSKHFLHCIGQPYEGDNVDWDSDEWLGRLCKIKLGHELPNEYHKYPKGIVVEYMPLDETAEKAKDEESPF
jgi:hypothetical protein